MSYARRAFSNQLHAALLVLVRATSPLPGAGERSPPTFGRRGGSLGPFYSKGPYSGSRPNSFWGIPPPALPSALGAEAGPSPMVAPVPFCPVGLRLFVAPAFRVACSRSEGSTEVRRVTCNLSPVTCNLSRCPLSG
jgi:hypothetical protein